MTVQLTIRRKMLHYYLYFLLIYIKFVLFNYACMEFNIILYGLLLKYYIPTDF